MNTSQGFWRWSNEELWFGMWTNWVDVWCVRKNRIIAHSLFFPLALAIEGSLTKLSGGEGSDLSAVSLMDLRPGSSPQAPSHTQFDATPSHPKPCQNGKRMSKNPKPTELVPIFRPPAACYFHPKKELPHLSLFLSLSLSLSLSLPLSSFSITPPFPRSPKPCDIHYDVHPQLMRRLGQRPQLLQRSQTLVDGREVQLRVPRSSASGPFETPTPSSAHRRLRLWGDNPKVSKVAARGVTIGSFVLGEVLSLYFCYVAKGVLGHSWSSPDFRCAPQLRCYIVTPSCFRPRKHPMRPSKQLRPSETLPRRW